VGASDTCDACKVTIWGGRDFNGWEQTFEPGSYSAVELEYRGVKCDDISSLEVVGDFCKMTAFEFGDFNVAHDGWVAKFGQGKYDSVGIEAAGAKNNDISSFKIVKLGSKVSVSNSIPNSMPNATAVATPIPAASVGYPLQPHWNLTGNSTGLPKIPGVDKIPAPWRSCSTIVSVFFTVCVVVASNFA
jgi:hypothetical protein